MQRRYIILGLVLVGAALALAACAGATGPAGPAGPQGPVGPAGPAGAAGAAPKASDLSCTQCHNDTTLIDGKETAWAASGHGTGTAYVRGTSASCAGCHSGGGFSAMVAAGLTPDTVKDGDPNPTRQDCRACHQIHTTYTKADFALETTDPVTEIVDSSTTFDGGKGNLCANCHQARTLIPAATDGMIQVDSTHWGPHHGPQSATLLGIVGAGDVQGSPSPHYKNVADTCVTCHLGSTADHTFMPNVATCQTCHTDATSFDVDGVQTDVKGMLDDLQKALTAKGLLDDQGEPVVGSYPEKQADALWNWLFLTQDGSEGVHNPPYVKALLQASLADMQ